MCPQIETDKGNIIGYASLGDMVTLLVGHRTCDLQVVGLNSGWHHCVVDV